MTDNRARTSRDQDAGGHQEWSPGDIAAKVAGGSADELSLVIRVLAARLADASGAVSDPRTVLLDLGLAAESLGVAVATVTADWQLDRHEDDEIRRAAQKAVFGLVDASIGLDDLQGTF